MQIDVIIPTYNRASVLKNAIISVLEQSYKNFHLYIVDDGSTDESDCVLEEFKNHAQIHLMKQPNQGVSAARNLGIKNSSSPWISFLDSDDTWLPNKLAAQVEFFRANPKLRFLHTDELWIRKGVRVNPKIKHQKSGENLFHRSLDFCLISPSTVCLKRELMLEHGLFNESFIVCEDYDLWLKILAREEIGFLPTAYTIKNGGHADQLSTQFVAMDYWRIKSLVALFQENISADKKEEIKQTLKRKGTLLLQGYLKHDNQKHYKEIETALSSVGITLPF